MLISKIVNIKNLRKILLKTQTLMYIYILLGLGASLHLYLLGPRMFAGREYTHYNNYFTFKYSYQHLVQNKDLYKEYPEEHWDYYKYSPTFALMMLPFTYLPDLPGLILWNILNALMLFFALKHLALEERTKALIMWFVALELLTSIQNVQSNGLVAGLIIFSYILMEKDRSLFATLLISITVYIKIFTAITFLLILLYPRKIRNVIYSVIWIFILGFLPLLSISYSQLKFLYSSWLNLLNWDYSDSAGLSVMGWLHSWFNINLPKDYVIFTGLTLLLLPLLQFKNYKLPEFRLNFLASMLIWMVIFNHKAESPTYIIALSGVALWYFTKARNTTNLILVILAYIFTSLSPTDIFPRFLRDNYVIPYVLKAIPCILIWFKLQYELILRKLAAIHFY